MSRRKPASAAPLFDLCELLEIAQAAHAMTRQRESAARHIRRRIEEGSVYTAEDLAMSLREAAGARALTVKALAAAFPVGPYGADLLTKWDAIFEESDARAREREGATP